MISTQLIYPINMPISLAWYFCCGSFDSSLSIEEREKKIRQAVGRAGFVQDLLLCTLLED